MQTNLQHFCETYILDMEIQLIEMRRFNVSSYTIPSNEMSFSMSYPMDFFNKEMEKLTKKDGTAQAAFLH